MEVRDQDRTGTGESSAISPIRPLSTYVETPQRMKYAREGSPVYVDSVNVILYCVRCGDECTSGGYLTAEGPMHVVCAQDAETEREERKE